MDIRRVRVVRFRIPFCEPYITADGTVTHREGFLVELETDDGIVGLGEGSLLPHMSEGLDALEASLRGLAERAAGADMAEFGGGVSVKREMGWPPFAFAMTDVITRARDQSVASLFLRPPQEFVKVNALIGGGSAEQVKVAATRAIKAGYDTVKLKVGVSGSVDEERQRVAAVRDLAGPNVGLRLDANGAWTEGQATEMLKVLRGYDIEYIEQPVAPGRLDVLRRLRMAGVIPIAADEDVFDNESAARVLETGSADVLILKPLQFSGIGSARALAERAAAAGIRAVVTTSIDTGVGTAVALHLAAALDTQDAHGLSTLSLLEDDLIAGPGLPIEAGQMRLPHATGLGVELDEAAVDKYAVAQWSFEA